MTEHVWDGKIFVGGEFVAPSGGTQPVVEKATGQTLATAGVGTHADVDAAVDAANAAQTDWWQAAYDERAGVLRRAAQVLERRADEFADWIVRETGSIRGKADYEVGAAVNELYNGAALTTRATGEIVPSHNTGKMSIIQRVPVGVVGAMTPWNFPLVLGMRVIAPALGLGNAVVLKPSPETPATGGLLLAELFAEAGAPAGLFNVVGGDKDVGEHLVTHPGTHMIHFTGSSATGAAIAEAAGRLLKKVSMELGGNNAFVVLDDADLDAASMVGAWSTYHYQGQTCITASRHIVLRAVADEYVSKLAARAKGIVVGDPATDAVGIGPMINERQRDRAHGFLTRSVEAGAEVVEGGTYDGLFYRPSVVTGVGTEMPLYTEEVFGPIAPITIAEDEEEALALVNGTPYGLVNGVFTGDEMRGLRFAERVRSGMVHVNDATTLDEAHVPFGGMGQSGVGGRSGGDANLEEFTERRWIGLQRSPVAYPY